MNMTVLPKRRMKVPEYLEWANAALLDPSFEEDAEAGP
jgi:hypothetical protein